MESEKLLYRLTEIGIALSKERDYHRLLEKILMEARSFTNAEGGSLYIRDGNELVFLVSQNDALAAKTHFTGKRLPLNNQSIAGHVGLTGQTINLRDVYDLPPETPFNINYNFDRENNYRTRSMLVTALQESGEEPIGVLALINAKSPKGEVIEFDSRYESLILSLASQAAISLRNAQLTNELKEAYLDTILRLSRAAECRDTDTAHHIERISLYSCVVAKEMGCSQTFVENIRYASPMHDVGKIGVADSILLKPGKLTKEEYEEMKRHTIYGAKILDNARANILRVSEEIALTHHEKYDGTGYPYGLKGEEIPLAGRIVALVDVFDALASKRCYKDAWKIEDVIEHMKAESGKHFDPEVLQAFLRCLDKILKIKEEYSGV